MKTVLAGFVGTYTSRYSDRRGYWLHGQLPFDSPQYEFDLLGLPSDDETPECWAWRQAIRQFAEQVAKSGLTLGVVREARLQITKLPEIINGCHGTQMSDGHMVQFFASAMLDGGRVFVQQRTVFVAPHDPKKERRRSPDNWGT